MPEQYRIHVPEDVLKDLKARLRNTRWPEQLEGSGWDYGTDTAYLKQLCAYWADGFDWRKQETRLNGFHQYRETIDGLRIHFIHERGRGPNPIPLLMLHGWPSTFVQFEKIIPLLTDPASHGAPNAPSFDVVVASLPGYGFSDIPKTRGFAIQSMAQCFTKLMTDSLGYKRFALRGSDIGHSVTQQLALAPGSRDRRACDRPFARCSARKLRAAERSRTEIQSGHGRLGSTGARIRPYARHEAANTRRRPERLAGRSRGMDRREIPYVGRHEGQRRVALLERRIAHEPDDLLGDGNDRLFSAPLLRVQPRETPAGQSHRAYGASSSPRTTWSRPREESASACTTSRRWTQTDTGGHFLEWEEPQLVAEDMRAFFGSLPGTAEPRREAGPPLPFPPPSP